MDDENPRSTLVDLVGQVHQMQQIVREKEMLMKRNEISSNFKVTIKTLLSLFVLVIVLLFQHDSLMQKISILEKQVEQEKRLNTNLTAEIESSRRELRQIKESSFATNQDQTKQTADLKRLHDEQIGRLERQADELKRLNAKWNEASLANKQLNDELNEKTEQICRLHSENSRYLL